MIDVNNLMIIYDAKFDLKVKKKWIKFTESFFQSGFRVGGAAVWDVACLLIIANTA